MPVLLEVIVDVWETFKSQMWGPLERRDDVFRRWSLLYHLDTLTIGLVVVQADSESIGRNKKKKPRMIRGPFF